MPRKLTPPTPTEFDQRKAAVQAFMLRMWPVRTSAEELDDLRAYLEGRAVENDWRRGPDRLRLLTEILEHVETEEDRREAESWLSDRERRMLETETAEVKRETAEVQPELFA